MTSEQTLPITAKLEERIKSLSGCDCEDCKQRIMEISFNLLQQVRTLESEHVANVSRAKEESAIAERERIVGILEEYLSEKENIL